MARLLTEPEEKTVKCRDCGATIAYLPEEVEKGTRSVMYETESWERVKCPRKGCPGYGYIRNPP